MSNSAILYSVVLLVGYASLCSCLHKTKEKSILDETDYYKILGVDKKASKGEIKQSFRKLALKYHPDKSKDPNAEKIFPKIAEAYDVLSNPEKRKQYDLGGSEGFNFQNTGATFDFRNFNFDNLFQDFDDDLDFGNMFGGSRFKLFDDIPNLFDSNDHFGRGDSFFKDFSAGREHGHASSYQRQQQTGRSCRTVTKKVGNTITTYTTCT